MLKTPKALPRVSGENQFAIATEALGNAPASPAPNRKRTPSRTEYIEVAPVSAVNTDHQTTMRVSTRLAPSLSPRWPLGISNSP